MVSHSYLCDKNIILRTLHWLWLIWTKDSDEVSVSCNCELVLEGFMLEPETEIKIGGRNGQYLLKDISAVKMHRINQTPFIKRLFQFSNA